MQRKLARFLNDSAFQLTAFPTRIHNHSRVDCRTPAEAAVEAVLAAVGTYATDAISDHGGPTAHRGVAKPVRDADTRDRTPGETCLWIASIQDALECASAIRAGTGLPSTAHATSRHRNPREYEDFARAAERRCLRLWVADDYVGSLRWIADEIGLSDRLVSRIRERITEALDVSVGRARVRTAA